MSGPKSYSPPPRYSINVFDGQLNEVFKLQSEIQTLFEFLSKSSVTDKDHSINFDNSSFLLKNNDLIINAIKTFSINHKGTFGQELYGKFKNELTDKCMQLNTVLDKLQKEKINFLDKKEDYESYIAYENYLNQSVNSYDDFKSQIVNYFESYLKSDYPDIFNRSKEEVSKINLELSLDNFRFGFKDLLEIKKGEIQNKVKRCEQTINQVRVNISTEIADSGFIIDSYDAKYTKVLKAKNEKIKKRTSEILDIISEISDTKRKDLYRDKLDKLIESPSFQDEYFYIELIDEIKNIENSIFIKEKIKEHLLYLNQEVFHKNLLTDKTRLIDSGLSLVNKDRIKYYEYEDFIICIKNLKEKNNNLQEEAAIQIKEKQFLKMQLVEMLQNMNYKVMDDMQIIDFEKENDFIFGIPKQTNFINLRFNEDGSLFYNFLIPEDKNKLGIEQKKKKLIEMENSCNSFKSVLKELADIGLIMNLHSEKPVSEKVLITVPDRHKSKIEDIKSHKKSKETLKNKYLNT